MNNTATKTPLTTAAKPKARNEKLVKIVTVAMLSAVSFVLYLLEFPILPSMGHLKLDLSDIPALLAGLMFGAQWAVPVELLKNIIELIVKGMGTQMGFGNLMNFIVGCAYIIPFCLVYQKLIGKEKKRAASIVIASVVGIVSIIVFGIIGNYFIDPPFFKYFLGVELTSETLWPAIWSATALNAIKGVMLSIVSFPIILALIDRLKKAMKM
ncbi:MAG: ECF transporter S component [Acutalibacteraceae bacterium]